MNLAEPIDIRTGRPFADRVHPHHRETPLERASTGGRARGLLGGLFGGCMMAAQGGKTYDVQDYVGWGTSDLVAMWDGIRNVGATADHSTSATTWTDLARSGLNFGVGSSGAWNDTDGFVCNGTRTLSYYRSHASLSNIFDGTVSATLEVVCSVSSETSAASSGSTVIIFNIDVNFNRGIRAIRYQSLNRIGIGATWSSSYGYCGFTDDTLQSHSFVGTVGGDGSCAWDNYAGGALQRSDTNTTGLTIPNTSYLEFGYGLKGTVKAIRLYSRALTAAEVAANYAVDAARFGLE